jgi:hypothetical protein
VISAAVWPFIFSLLHCNKDLDLWREAGVHLQMHSAGRTILAGVMMMKAARMMMNEEAEQAIIIRYNCILQYKILL